MDQSEIFSSNKTTLEDILNLKKEQISSYLRNRKQKISGNKHELATRALNFHRIELGISESLSPSGSTETENLSINSTTTNCTPNYNELNSGWTSDPTHLPKITVKEIEKYLIHSSHRTSDSLKMECYRQYIRGLNFYKEKYIHKVMINDITEENEYCYVRSKCHPSMKQGIYIQWVLMTKESPTQILKASCTCPAGLGEGCAHIAGLLFAIEGNSSEEKDSTACTSKPCEWNKPSKRKKDPQPIENIKFKKIKLHDSESKNRSKPIREKASEENMSSFRNKLCARLGNQSNAVLFDLLAPCDDETAVESDLNVANEVEVETSETIVYKSDRYINLKKTVSETSMSASDFLEKFSACDPDVVSEIETRTKGQNENPLWFQSRAGRITASVFHDVLHRKDTTPSQKLVDKILCDSSEKSSLNVPALKWGRKMEIVAKKQYKAIKKLKFKQNVKIIDQGLYVHQQHSFLGASPDGKVIQNEEMYLIEIKCPYKWRFKTLSDACSDKDFFCYIDEHGKFLLKETHRYYTQIQGQMGICGIDKCDLVIYTTKDLKFLTISFNPVFWEVLLKQLKLFYSQYVLPNLIKSTN